MKPVILGGFYRGFICRHDQLLTQTLVLPFPEDEGVAEGSKFLIKSWSFWWPLQDSTKSHLIRTKDAFVDQDVPGTKIKDQIKEQKDTVQKMTQVLRALYQEW
jgi:hypothetical protein